MMVCAAIQHHVHDIDTNFKSYHKIRFVLCCKRFNRFELSKLTELLKIHYSDSHAVVTQYFSYVYCYVMQINYCYVTFSNQSNL